MTKGKTQKLRLSKPTDMTIHWKATEEHFLMEPLVFRFNPFLGNFSEFLSKNISAVVKESTKFLQICHWRICHKIQQTTLIEHDDTWGWTS
jgi:hypothetical protein